MSLIRQILQEAVRIDQSLTAAAKKAGYIGPFWHGTKAKFTEFSHAYSRGQLGFHVGTKAQAKWFSSRPKPFFIFAHKPLRLPDTGSWYGYEFRQILSKALGCPVVLDQDRYLRDLIKSKGYDSIVYLNTKEWSDQDGDAKDSFILFEPWQLKLAVETLDDSGNPIPLEQRFDRSSNDIRF